MDMTEKLWRVDTPPLKKLLAKTITYHLSRKLNKGSFEVVYESNLDPRNPESEKPDVVVYLRNNNYKPIIAIEMCLTKEIPEALLEAGKILKTHQLREFFIFDFESNSWFRVDDSGNMNSNSFSSYFSLDLKDLSELFPDLF